MRFVRFLSGGAVRHGIVERDAVVELRGALFDPPEPTGARHALAGLRLLPPVVPRGFYALGVNYIAHRRYEAELMGKPYQPPVLPTIGFRGVNALVGPDDPIVVPGDSSGRVQFEAELVVVIGRPTRNVGRDEALGCVFGYTVGNDVSERTWQKSDATIWRAKNCDTFKPMGPWIETDVDLDAMATVVRLNGREVSRFRTADMVFGVAETIATISRNITLSPGDVIWMGTDDPTLDMVAGDRVEIELTGIGTLANPVVAGT